MNVSEANIPYPFLSLTNCYSLKECNYITKNNSNLAFPNEKENSFITVKRLPKYKVKNKVLMKYVFMLLTLI